MRDRLVELLCNVKCEGEECFGNCPHRIGQKCNKVQRLEMCSVFAIADHLLAEGIIVPPCAIGDTVYHITTCEGFYHELDGSLYDSLGGVGDATGYYCPCELRDNCPFDNEEDFDCDNLKTKQAVFEDTVKGFFVEEYETYVFLEYSGNVRLSDFGKTVFLTREEAEKALAERSGE